MTYYAKESIYLQKHSHPGECYSLWQKTRGNVAYIRLNTENMELTLAGMYYNVS